MTASQQVSVSEIRQWMNAICDALEAKGVSEIALEQDYYWSVFSDDAFDMSRQPEPVVGSLQDDFGDLRREMAAFQSQDIGMIVGHACHHLQGIVNYLALRFSGIVVSTVNKAAGGAHA
jgi:hypothetical protein